MSAFWSLSEHVDTLFHFIHGIVTHHQLDDGGSVSDDGVRRDGGEHLNLAGERQLGLAAHQSV